MHKKYNIGIFGGSFSPFHYGHLNILVDFINENKLDFLLITPNFVSPFKISQDNLFNNIQRINIINSYISNLDETLKSKILVLDFEINKSEISYTIDTLNFITQNINTILGINLQSTNPIQYYFLIGDDNLENFDKWKNWEEILELVNLTIAFRIENKDFLFSIIEQKYIQFKNKINLLKNPIYEVSATEIRNQLIEFAEILKAKDYNQIKSKYSELLININNFTIKEYLKTVRYSNKI